MLAGAVLAGQVGRVVQPVRSGRAEYRLAEFLATFYGPTNKALAALGADQAASLKTEMVETARRFDISDDDTLVLRQDYLEVVVHKPATP